MPYKDKQKEKVTKSKWRAANPEKIKASNKKSNYFYCYPNATIEDYQEYLEATHCEVCGVELTIKSSPSIRGTDKVQHHDHDTGEILEVICQSCNMIEGHARTPEQLEAIAQWQKRKRK